MFKAVEFDAALYFQSILFLNVWQLLTKFRAYESLSINEE